MGSFSSVVSQTLKMTEKRILYTLLIFSCFAMIYGSTKTGKAISVFNIVKFANDVCNGTDNKNVKKKEARPVGLAPKAMACVVPLRWGAATRSPRTRHISNLTTRPVGLATLKFVVATKIYAKCALISLPSKLLPLPLPLPLYHLLLSGFKIWVELHLMPEVDARLIHFLWSYPEDHRHQLFVEPIRINTCTLMYPRTVLYFHFILLPEVA